MDGTAQSFIMDFAVMSLSYSSFWHELPHLPPQKASVQMSTLSIV